MALPSNLRRIICVKITRISENPDFFSVGVTRGVRMWTGRAAALTDPFHP